MKSRGMSHSNQVREFTITDNGLNLVDVYLGPEGVLTGSAREAQKLKEKTGVALRDFAVSRKDKEILRRRMMLESKIASLQAEFESAEEELNKMYLEDELKQDIIEKNRQEITNIRRGNVNAPKSKSKSKK
jgi:circadian clock protein KaiC